MRRGARFFLLLLVAAYTAAGLPRVIVHEQDDHEVAGQHRHGAVDNPGEAALQVLLHGHAHPDGAPPHSHRIAPTLPARHEVQDFQAPTDLGPPSFAVVAQPIPAHFEPARPVDAPGTGPPSRLHWLCTLLI